MALVFLADVPLIFGCFIGHGLPRIACASRARAVARGPWVEQGYRLQLPSPPSGAQAARSWPQRAPISLVDGLPFLGPPQEGHQTTAISTNKLPTPRGCKGTFLPKQEAVQELQRVLYSKRGGPLFQMSKKLV